MYPGSSTATLGAYDRLIQTQNKKPGDAKIIDDVSFGIEKYPIPVFNHYNKNKIDPQLEYFMTCTGLPKNTKPVPCCKCNPGECFKNTCSCRKMSQLQIKDHRILEVSKIINNTMANVLVECREGCSCKRDCANWATQKYCPFKVQLEVFNKKGFGVRDFFGEYIGDIITPANHTNQAYQFAVECSYKEKNLFMIDARIRGNITRFVNHSCNPILRPFLFINSSVNSFKYLQLGYVFIKDAIPGRELTIDYGPDYVRLALYDCCCGSSNCERPSEETQDRTNKDRKEEADYEKFQQTRVSEVVREYKRKPLIQQGKSPNEVLKLVPEPSESNVSNEAYLDRYNRSLTNDPKVIEIVTIDEDD